ncbi:MAG TPA: RNA polymerase sigma factor, partial [Acidimicrobiales bacterium]|nr:RNA polymerase sigma factor [Acidimicrobiales bacterium]
MATRAPDYTLEGESGDRARYLVLAHQAGDPFAFTEIVTDHYRSLYAHAARRMGDRRAAEAVVPEALLRAYKGLDRFGGDYNLAGWLHRIVDNVCIDETSRRHREVLAAQRFSAFSDPDGASPPADEVLGYDDHASLTVRAAVASLPDTYREALVLRDVMDLEYVDLAERIGTTEENARARVSRARAALKRLIGPVVVVIALLGRAARRGTGTAARISA